MTIFPLTTLLSRRREIRKATTLVDSLDQLEAKLGRQRFVTLDDGEQAKKIRKRLRDASSRLAAQIERNRTGTYTTFSAGQSGSASKAGQELIAADMMLRLQLDEAEGQIRKSLDHASALIYDDARKIQHKLSSLQETFRQMRSKGARSNQFQSALSELRSQMRNLSDLETLIQLSAKAQAQAEQIAQLPLRETNRVTAQREVLLHSAESVARARELGDARILREEWERLSKVSAVLQRESEVWVARAIRELESWRTNSELHPELSQRWASRWSALLTQRNRSGFLQEWNDAKLELAGEVQTSFIAHWAQTTSRTQRAARIPVLTWSDVEKAARQARKSAMPPIYSEKK